MPTTYAIPNGRTVMDVNTYTGTGSNVAIVNADLGTTGFQPDLVWIKCRSNAYDNDLFDSIRGPRAILVSNSTNTQDTQAAGKTLTAFNTNGFQLGTDNSSSGSVNNTGFTYVAWQWQAGQGTTSTNNNGSVSSTTSVNDTAGFSIVTFTCTGVNINGTVGHGLSVAPSLIITKSIGSASNWVVYHSSVVTNVNEFLRLNDTSALTTLSQVWGSTLPTSTVFGIRGDVTLAASATAVAYCWSEIAGFSKFGSYTGNGSADGNFIYTGFRPKFVMLKRTDSTSNWGIWDSTRNPYNIADLKLYPNLSNAETTSADFDILSNGIKLRTTYTGTWIYVAFAENPFKYSNAR